jgi:hypothetical protein
MNVKITKLTRVNTFGAASKADAGSASPSGPGTRAGNRDLKAVFDLPTRVERDAVSAQQSSVERLASGQRIQSFL